ncbi:MAG: sterol desaturase family protein [Nitrospira sp.]|jgi:sterol desaturase/sphingolipid hydroxylase (fatty acid hydroxylase superfamily)|nr:sterol desaturase family protein [Nitrospira sp. BO4]
MVDFLTNLISLEWLAIYWGIGLLFFAAEYCWPSRALLYRHVFLQDVGAFITYQVFFVVATQVTDRIPFPDYSHWRWQAVPFGFKLLVFLFVMDGIAYWMHRLWHTSWGWPIHRWHHSPTELYWLAGIRASLPQVALANIPYLLAFPLLKPVPALFFPLYSYMLILTNNWMHMNVTWQSKKLEWFFVTPRYHRVHHLRQIGRAGANFGVLFTVWDRLFGTYADPDQVETTGPYGISEAVHPVRLAIGI